ncbi:MAG TPA: prohibitin family protein [Bryobacteraceae bacterium]|nr:prohibitin family protein [Bryobacteraceae bacterium]
MIVDTGSTSKPEVVSVRPPVGRVVRARLRRHANALLVVLGVLLFLVVYFAPTIFVTVQSGEVGVMYRRFLGGTETDRVYGEGLTFVPPWDKFFIYSIRVQEVKHEMQVLTQEGLSVKLDLSIRYHPEPEMVGMLHQRVGPDYKDRVVIPEVESAMRTIMGRFTMRDVYGSERGLVQKVINESLEHVSQDFVKVDEIVLRDVELPAKVQDAIEQKMTEKELAEAYEYKLDRETQEAKRKQIEAQGIKQYNETVQSSLTPSLLRWEGIEATKELAQSPNAKMVFMGNRANDLPVILGGEK